MPIQLIPQSVVRGTVAFFEQIFVDGAGHPLTPSDPTRYPEITITDRDGTVIQTGVATSMGDGRWRFQWFVPADAELSTAIDQWQIEWRLITTSGREVTHNSNFAIIDTVEANPSERAYTNIVYAGTSERVIIKFHRPPEELSVTLSNGDCHVNLTSGISSVVQGGYHVFYADTPSLDVGNYLVIWQARDTRISPQQTFVQQIRVPDQRFWMIQPDIRMLIDKIQKKVGYVQSYSDSDIYGYLLRGIDIVNGTNPPTYWGFPQMMGYAGLTTYLIAASAWWGLQAQYISEAELGFNYSGQTITLDVERASAIESAISRLKEYLDQLKDVKAAIIRKVSVGTVNVRPYNYRIYNRVYKVSSTQGPGTILPLLTDLGLI